MHNLPRQNTHSQPRVFARRARIPLDTTANTTLAFPLALRRRLGQRFYPYAQYTSNSDLRLGLSVLTGKTAGLRIDAVGNANPVRLPRK